MGALGLGIYMAPPAPSRSFPLYNQNGDVVYPQFAYPLRKEVVPIWLSALLSFLIPFIFFSLFQIRRRSLNDLANTTMGLLKSLITAAVFQVRLSAHKNDSTADLLLKGLPQMVDRRPPPAFLCCLQAQHPTGCSTLWCWLW